MTRFRIEIGAVDTMHPDEDRQVSITLNGLYAVIEEAKSVLGVLFDKGYNAIHIKIAPVDQKV